MFAVNFANPINLLGQTVILQENFDATTTGSTSCGATSAAPSGWSQDTQDDMDWSALSGNTGSSNTGPTSDHTTGNGKYMYTESSSCYGKTAHLISPSMNLSGYNNATLKFYYHMYGTSMGTLSVEISINGDTSWTSIWSKSGNQANSWIEATIYMNSYCGSGNNNVKIRFKGVTGSSYTSDIAIDDIIIYSLYSNDLMMLSLDNPVNGTNPSANVPIKVKVVNNGSMSQNGFQLKYSVDSGSTWVTETYNDTANDIFPMDTLDYLFSTTANMSSSGMYHCIAVVKNPGDQIAINDTIYANPHICNQLYGAYTIGSGSGYDFQTFNEAIQSLNSCGVSGPVTFNVAPGTYPEVMTFTPIPGASATNTITFKGVGESSVINATVNMSNYSAIYPGCLSQSDYQKSTNVSANF